MATKPTRAQVEASRKLADALLLIADAARLDGKARLDPTTFVEIASRMTRASSAFDFDAIVALALEGRGRALGLRSGTAELLSLLDNGSRPLDLILLPDDDFRAVVARLEDELGEV